MKGTINTQMIILAREARGMSQLDLSDLIGMSATNLSKIERGDIGIQDEHMVQIAEATAFPIQFFYQKGRMVPENLVYRKRQSVPQKIITPILARANVLRLQVQFLMDALSLKPAVLPVMGVQEKQSPAFIARKLRQKWEIKDMLTEPLIRIMEEKGIIIIPFDFETERVDSFSMMTDDKQPLIFINERLLGDRLRFSLAYELGQLIMHTYTELLPDRDIKTEANEFAAELLMPAREVVKDLENISLAKLGTLKKKWKVSMISLVYRADDLGLLTPNQKRYLIQQFNSLNIRRREPIELDIAVEKPRLLKQWLAKYRTRTGLGLYEMAAVLCLQPDEFMEIYS